MKLEIERKFLLPAFPDEWIGQGKLVVLSRARIEQTYVALFKDEELRVRKISDEDTGAVSWTHTYKKGSGGIRKEVEVPIGEGLYDQLTRLIGFVPLVKTRTTCRWTETGTIIEIDSYSHLPLTIAEVEFAGAPSSAVFAPLPWFGEEITGHKKYSNKSLWKQIQPK